VAQAVDNGFEDGSREAADSRGYWIREVLTVGDVACGSGGLSSGTDIRWSRPETCNRTFASRPRTAPPSPAICRRLEALPLALEPVARGSKSYMRLLKESVLRVMARRKASVKNEVANAEHRAKAIQLKLDRLDDAFIYKESIDLATYERQRDRLPEELTLVEIDRHGSKVEEFDVDPSLVDREETDYVDSTRFHRCPHGSPSFNTLC
jgi:hypothetical protein